MPSSPAAVMVNWNDPSVLETCNLVSDRINLYGAQSLDTTYGDSRWPVFTVLYFEVMWA